MKQQQFKKTVLASLLALTSGVALSAPYEIVDLGGLGGNYSVAYEINEQGVAVGTANGPINEDGQRQFFSHATKFWGTSNEDLGVLADGTLTEAIGINNSGRVVGYGNVVNEIEDDNGNTTLQELIYAIVFDSQPQALPEQEGLVQTRAYAINDNNIIIGHGKYDVDPDDDNNPVDRGFIYDSNNQSYYLVPPLADEPTRQSYLTDISNSGMVLGFSDVKLPDSSQYTIQSFIVDTNNSNSIIEIPSKDNRPAFAHSINIHDEVVGSIYIPGTRNNQEAFYYDPNSGSSDLTFLGFIRSDFSDSRARDINDNGQIVGRALISAPTLNEFAAFIYENEQMKNLNELIPCDSGWKLTDATSINNAGQIVGFGVKDGEIRAFRLDPTGGDIEVCETDDDTKSGGGSIPLITLMILGFVGLRRKLNK